MGYWFSEWKKESSLASYEREQGKELQDVSQYPRITPALPGGRKFGFWKLGDANEFYTR
jgi:hypothetical protein